jgi:hypothetical protein
MDVDVLVKELMAYLDDVQVEIEGDRIYSNYQKVTAYTLRLQEMHNDIALLEIRGGASPELKKFRTMILDPTIERLEKVAQFESRKITAKQLEANLER